jgi:hypothetical protein
MAIKEEDEYGSEESKRRFEAALKGARIAGHKPMESLIKKKPKAKKAPRKKTRK